METGREGGVGCAGEAVRSGGSAGGEGVDCAVEVLLTRASNTSTSVVTEIRVDEKQTFDHFLFQ